MDFRVVHPIPLTVADVVTELHVLDALRGGQRGGSQCPAGPASAGGDHKPCREVEAALKRDGPLNVCPIMFTARILDVATDCLKCDTKRLEVRLPQVSVFGCVCYPIVVLPKSATSLGVIPIRTERR